MVQKRGAVSVTEKMSPDWFDVLLVVMGSQRVERNLHIVVWQSNHVTCALSELYVVSHPQPSSLSGTHSFHYLNIGHLILIF